MVVWYQHALGCATGSITLVCAHWLRFCHRNAGHLLKAVLVERCTVPDDAPQWPAKLGPCSGLRNSD